jgi:hypothetical protein
VRMPFRLNLHNSVPDAIRSIAPNLGIPTQQALNALLSKGFYTQALTSVNP